MKMRSTIALGLLGLALALTGCGGGGGSDTPASQVAATTVTVNGAQASATAPVGALTGVAGTATVAFRGIPFARPPVGDLRWKPPVAAAAWTGTLDATKASKHCWQEGGPTDTNASEDCLYLNVYAPTGVAATGSAKRPVMVWIYGGANATGAGDSYDPTELVKTGDAVVVTFNYRVGALGFLAHPVLDGGGGPTVNYGVMDQQLALRWVRDNIASFGGDSTNVTIFGESAGGLNTTSHLVSPLSAGLFHKAIIESGGYLIETPSLAQAEAKGTAFAQRLGCTSGDVAACMRAKTATEILAQEGVVNTDSAAYYQMAVDGVLLKEQATTALYAGRFNRVPVIVGSNAHEGNFFFQPPASVTNSVYSDQVALFSAKDHRTAAWTTAVYPIGSATYPTAFDATSGVLGDSEFSCPARRTQQWLSNYVTTYAYEFNDPASLFASGHFSEIYYLFQFKGQTAFGIFGPASSQALATAMRQYWTNFAHTGNPNASGLAAWKPYTPVDHQLQLLTAPAPTADASGGTDFVSRHNCDFWGVE